MAHGHHISVPDKDVGFAEGDALVDDLGRASDDEQHFSILLQLRMLVGLAGVFDGEGVEIELCLHPRQQLIAWFEQTDPNDMARLFGPRAGFLDRDARHAPTVDIDARGDDAGVTFGLRDVG